MKNDKNLTLSQSLEDLQKSNLEYELLKAKIDKLNSIIAEKDNVITKQNKTIIEKDNVITDQNKIITEKDDVIASQNKTITEKNKTIAVKENVIASQNKTIIEKDNVITNQNKTIIEKDNVITNQNEAIAVKENVIASQNKTIAKKDEAIAKKDSVIAEGKKTIADQQGVINEQKALIKEQKEIIKRVKKFIIDLKIMKQKAVDALFGKASAKTKNLASDLISNEEKQEDNQKEPVKDKGDPQKRGRKEGTQNFSNWGDENCVKDEKTFDSLDNNICPDCGGNLKLEGYTTYYKASIIPQRIKLTTMRVAILRCVNCGKVVYAKVPKEYIDCFGQSACTPSLAGYLAMLSCGLFLPNQRISTLFSYAGTPLSKELITRYLLKTALILSNFYELLRKEALKAHILHMDETYWNALEEKDNQTNYIWSMTTGIKEPHQVAYYMYAPNRAYSNLEKMAGGYDGAIISDSYGAYFTSVIHQLCMSHMRKYLYDYLQAAKGITDSEDVKQVSILLDKCNKIFAKERELEKLDEEELLQKRQDELKPLLDNYFATAQSYYNPDIKDSKNRAINYGLKNKDLYYQIIKDPKIPLTNNRAEQTMRKAVMKRVNSLFSSSIKGADSFCKLLTVVQTARLNNLSPDKYIQHLLEHYEELEDGRTAIKYLPWSPSLPESIKFTQKEINKAKANQKEN